MLEKVNIEKRQAKLVSCSNITKHNPLGKKCLALQFPFCSQLVFFFSANGLGCRKKRGVLVTRYTPLNPLLSLQKFHPLTFRDIGQASLAGAANFSNAGYNSSKKNSLIMSVDVNFISPLPCWTHLFLFFSRDKSLRCVCGTILSWTCNWRGIASGKQANHKLLQTTHTLKNWRRTCELEKTQKKRSDTSLQLVQTKDVCSEQRQRKD